jgi:hypothetical protein
MPFVYNMTVDDPKMTKDIIRVIDAQEDKQSHSTNVKAQMTEWRMQDQEGFRDLCYYIENAVVQASLIKYRKEIIPIIHSMWGLKYKSSEFAVEHSHYPATWACTYYLNPPDGCPGIEFRKENDEWYTIDIHHGLLLVFEGNSTHRVSKKEFAGYRYVVSCNISHDFTQSYPIDYS